MISIIISTSIVQESKTQKLKAPK